MKYEYDCFYDTKKNEKKRRNKNSQKKIKTQLWFLKSTEAITQEQSMYTLYRYIEMRIE